jgi:hypothetical protein
MLFDKAQAMGTLRSTQSRLTGPLMQSTRALSAREVYIKETGISQ